MAPRKKKGQKEDDDLATCCKQHMTFAVEDASFTGNQTWACSCCGNTYSSSVTRIPVHYLGPKGKGISLCTKLEKADRDELQSVFNRVRETPGAIDARMRLSALRETDLQLWLLALQLFPLSKLDRDK